jgi:hypothetical protein
MNYYVGGFGDDRLKRNGAELLSKMIEQKSVCLRRLGGGRAGEMRFGRWLSNPKVTHQEIAREGCKKTGQLAVGLHVLALHDTSELNFQAHVGRTAGLGKVGNGKDLGLFIHPMLVIDAVSRACLGLAHQQSWIRSKTAGDYSKLPIEKKESYRWLQVAQAGKKCLKQAAMVTIIADRESDMYEAWDRIPDSKTHMLTRICRDRRLANGEKLYGWLEQQAVKACYVLDAKARPAKKSYVPGSLSKGKRSAHQAHMEVRYGEVEIVRPPKCRDKLTRESIKLWVVEVIEQAESVIDNEDAIHWRLFTTHQISSVEEALQQVDWYCERWQIEQLFRIHKKQGLNIESSQIEEADRLMKLANVATQAAAATLQLTMARDGNTDRPATDVFNADDILFMEALQPTLEGKTVKQKNPHLPGNLAWAAWMIARLGGWNGYASEAKPGPVTMLRGQQRFAAMAQGWKLARMCA